MPKKEKKVKKDKKQLPDKVLPICSSDKKNWTEKWYPGRNLLNLPHSFRMICIGPPSSGKSCMIKNIIVRSDPPFEQIICCHLDHENSKEWDDVNAEMVGELPDPTTFTD